jgi:iron uptake system component EfeO
MNHRSPGRNAALVPLVLGLAVALGACGSNGGKAGGGSVARTVEVALTDAGCEPAELQLAAGAVTFNVTNKGTDKVSEFEVSDGDRILGEVENVTAGLERNFTLNLQPGDYVLKCPGGSTAPEGALAVTGEAGAATTSDTQLAGVAESYRRYVEGQAAALVSAARTFVNAVVAGDVPASQWGGFHKIEQALWARSTARGMAPVARKLLTDVTDLEAKVRTVELDAAQIANGASELLGEVSKSKITGEEERYSRIDLLDFKANLDGSRAAFDAVRPALDRRDAELGATIQSRFEAADRSLAPYRQGAGYLPYNRLTDADTRRLSQTIDALAEPLSQVSARLAAS